MNALASTGSDVEWKVAQNDRSGRCAYRTVPGSTVAVVDFTRDLEPIPDGFVRLEDFLNEFETDPSLADGLASARREIAAERNAAGERSLALLRMRRGLTQQQLADALGTKQPTVSRLELGQQVPGLSMLRRLAAVLGVDMNELVSVFPNDA